MKEAVSLETQAYAGTAVWNFSESGKWTGLRETQEAGTMHEILWKHGAVDALLGFLKSQNPRLQRVAIGALFGLLDYGILGMWQRTDTCLDSNTGAHLAIDYDKELVKKLVETKQDAPSWSFILAKTGCLLSLAKHRM